MRKWFFLSLCCVWSFSAFAHLGPKDVRSMEHPDNRAEKRWIVIDNLGLFMQVEEEFHWVCDEGLTPLPGLNSVAALGETGNIWLVGTRSGLRRSIDDGCSFLPPSPPLDNHVIAQLSTHPNRPNEALLSTQTLGTPNDLFLTEDGGDTWIAAGLAIQGRIRAFLRAPSDPERVYLIHAGGAVSSRDGGRTFEPFNLGPVELMASGTDIDLLAIHPTNTEEIFAAHATFPESTLIRSVDGGQSWTELTTVPDVPDSLAIDPTGQQIIFSTAVLGLYRSPDGGTTWEHLDRQLESGTISCLRFHERSHLLACARRSDSALILTSDDLGTSWDVVMRPTLDGVTRRTGCPSESESVEQCNYTCDDFPATCRPLDAGLPMPPDANEVTNDGGLRQDPPTHSSQGCAVNGGSGNPLFFWLLVPLMPLIRKDAFRRGPR